MRLPSDAEMAGNFDRAGSVSHMRDCHQQIVELRADPLASMAIDRLRQDYSFMLHVDDLAEQSAVRIA